MPVKRNLYLLRHAKSNWDDPGLADHERPLAARGRRATGVLADHVRSNGINPNVVLCSSARRTRETLEAVAPPGEWLIEPELYGASPGEVLARLQRLPDDVEAAMVVGHNPTMQMLAVRLASPAEDGAELAEVQRKFPTGALVTLSFEGNWQDLAPGRARVAEYVRPRQLAAR